MALPATDDFNRANANPAGGNWSACTSGGNVKILSNRLSGAGSSDFVAYWNADTPNNDQYAKCLVPLSASYDGGPGVRVNYNNIHNGYFYNVGFGSISKITNGSWSVVLWGTTGTYSATSVYKLQAVGNALTTFQDSTQTGTSTDSSFPSGNLGIGGYATDIIIDDWEGGNVGGAASSILMPKHTYFSNLMSL